MHPVSWIEASNGMYAAIKGILAFPPSGTQSTGDAVEFKDLGVISILLEVTTDG